MKVRKVLAAVTALGALTATAGCSIGGSPEAADGNSMTFVTYGSAFQDAQEKAFVEPFSEQTGTKVTVDSPVDIAKLKVMVQKEQPTWDVYLASQHEPEAYCGELFAKLDLSKIDEGDFAPGSVSDCGVPVDTYSYLISYNTEKYGDNPPTSIKDFFDPVKFPGTRALSNDPAEGNFELALLADGVPMEDMYPLDYERAIKVLNRVKKNLAFWETGAEQVTMMESRRADMILVWSGRGYEAVANGAPYKPIWTHNSYHWASLSIVKGSNNKDAAQFINYAVSKEPQEKWIEEIAYGPANLKAEPTLDPTRSEWESSLPEHRKKSWAIDTAWWSKNVEDARKRWIAWTSG